MKRLFILSALSSLLFFACQQTEDAALTEPIETTDETVEPKSNEIDIMGDNIATAHLALAPALFKMKMDNTEEKVLLDIRTADELAENGTIEGAINVDYYGENFQEEMEKLDREVPVMLYCRSGGRSGEAAALLKELGFKLVFDMQGGYNAWLEKGL